MKNAANPSPQNTIRVTIYQEVEQFLSAFARGLLNLLIFIGNAGLQKSETANTLIDQEACWVDCSHITALALYIQLFLHRDRPVVLDDVDKLYANADAVRLLKALCQTRELKTVSWLSCNPLLAKLSVPLTFETTSHVLVIANAWKSLNENVAALEDRGHVILFEPDALEVHVRVAEWFEDQEVFDFLAEWLHLIKTPSMRFYTKTIELKNAGFDWKDYFLRQFLTDAQRVAARFRFDPSFASEEERVRAFRAATGKCRATYYNLVRGLKPPAPPPKIIVRWRRPDMQPGRPPLLLPAPRAARSEPA
jgi:hypothetical protein